jgi:hypothetical protein
MPTSPVVANSQYREASFKQVKGRLELCPACLRRVPLPLTVCLFVVGSQAGWTFEPRGPFYVWRAWAAAHLPKEQVGAPTLFSLLVRVPHCQECNCSERATS